MELGLGLGMSSWILLEAQLCGLCAGVQMAGGNRLGWFRVEVQG